MKIVHFAKFFPPEYGGIESVTEALAEDHAAAGHEVEVVCFTRDMARVDKQGRLTIRRMKVQAEKSSQPLSASYLKTCACAAENADVVHVHTPNVFAALAVLRVPRQVKVVVHWHADIERKGLLGYLVRPVEHVLLRRADRVVTTSEAYGTASRTLTHSQNRVEFIPIGINDIDFTPDIQPIPRRDVLFVGRLVPYKGLKVLIEAVAHMQSETTVRIVGVGPDEEALKAQAKRIGVSDRIEFMGRVDVDRLQTLYAEAAIFCLPSVNRREAFGVVLLEAMRAGLAVVSTDIPGSGVPWVNASGLTVPVNNPKALARALDGLLTDSKEMLRIGMDGRKRFESEFSREKMSKRFLELYEKLYERRAA
ncbi:glycosyltransferase [Primorskyibacter sp. S87]|uniref:glycosyltransferase n=1 Tax=Primorskyibacter sp. S87 TaxID=3415126 RepID=UPI003C7BAD31